MSVRRREPGTDRRRHRARADRHAAAQIRTCCPTHRDEPHTRECRRSSKCRTKVAFPSRDAARRNAAKWNAANEGMEILSAYRCPDCAQWHTGHDGRTRDDL